MDELQVLFYGEITNFTVASFINRMNEAKMIRSNVDIVTNSMGGDSDAGYGLVKTTRDFPFLKKMTVHGAAYSMMAFALLYVNDSECIEQSQFLFHRAAALFEDDPTMQQLLIGRNQSLRQAMEEKLDIAAFTRISGVTLDDMFSMDQRIDVVFNADQAGEIGLIKNVLPLSANEAESLNQRMMAASKGIGIHKIDVDKFEMKTLAELKEKDPEGYKKLEAQMKAEMEKGEPTPSPSPAPTPAPTPQPSTMTAEQAVAEERQRVAEWNVFAEVDAKKVAEGISSGKKITDVERSEFLLQSNKNQFAQNLQGGNPSIETGPGGQDKSKETHALQGIESKLRASFGLKETTSPITSQVDQSVVS